MSNESTTTDAHWIGRRGERVAGTRGERTLGSVAWPSAGAAVALASVLFVGSSGEAVAQTPGEVWAGCELAPATVDALKGDMSPGIFDADGQVAFLFIYTMKDNNGQEFAAGPNGGEFTGPVICINPNADDVFKGVGIAEILQADVIPHPDSGATGTTSRDAEDVLIIRHQLADGPGAGEVEQVLCHGVNDGNDCFRISPLLR